ncbi:hypothetical protein E2C01_012163 [Portunus trituberculatus]|uniref:Uncharacterized protein n=1 Tax=Portunus trituberculatus TaxID=210409 RepID=A0A5B7DCZ8_PORTR|nr:hypothetical protein [Portunus trituberculatus]
MEEAVVDEKCKGKETVGFDIETLLKFVRRKICDSEENISLETVCDAGSVIRARSSLQWVGVPCEERGAPTPGTPLLRM